MDESIAKALADVEKEIPLPSPKKRVKLWSVPGIPEAFAEQSRLDAQAREAQRGEK